MSKVSISRISVREKTSTCSVSALEDLKEAKLVEYVNGESLEDNPTVEPLPEAHIMSKALIKFGSMKLLMSLTADMQLHQVTIDFMSCLILISLSFS